MSGAAQQEQRIGPDELAQHLLGLKGGARRLVAIAGAPGSGKSTFAQGLCADLNRRVPDVACVLAMDGFHFDDRVLEARGQRARKGAPHTFDVPGLAAMLGRLKADDGSEIAVPVFDRSIEIARAGAEIIPRSARLVVVEGNYLLLDAPGWSALQSYFDVTVMLEVPRDVLAQRLLARWRGYGMDEAAIRAKLLENDLPNVDLVLSQSVSAQFVVANT
ncbi:nucleoside triphosphate hydrolase [Paraburkholderia acidipaludis]|uniref:nucleoside triphosphate hydrolase n=1 Tax=Paraburkholderia acidipaludis TaxID=660537 RepID=UPI000AF2D4D0|nr:nucleoside triphosphate hydrolase [Paraburkholderia acidipaludis]